MENNILRETEVPYVTENKTRAFMKRAREGLTMEDFNIIAESAPLPLSAWSKILNISERSLQRYQKTGHQFSLPESEKLIRVAQLFSKGKSIFGNPDKFFSWLKSPSAPLSGDTPLSLLDSSFGLELVLDELTRIDHGIFV